MTKLPIALVLAGLVTACAAADTPPAEDAAPAPAAAEAVDACAPTDDLNFLCGLGAPEDLVPVPATRWLIASGMTAGSGLHAIDTDAKAGTPLLADGLATRPDAARFPSCAGPLDPAQAILHGLSLRPAQDGLYTLYATNHGGRESVEVFELDASGDVPAVTWVGCVPMADDVEANSVAVFDDGTMLATVVILPPFTFEEMFSGVPTGTVFQWTPGDETFTRLPGTDLVGNNGVETAPDGSAFYVAPSGGREIVAFSRGAVPEILWRAPLGFPPDNLRLVGDRLIAAGMVDDEPACGGPPTSPAGIQCPRGYQVAAVDPATGEATEIARGPAAPPYTGTATAIPVGDELWLSSFNTDRVAWRPLER
jgi:hypothetical protein